MFHRPFSWYRNYCAAQLVTRTSKRKQNKSSRLSGRPTVYFFLSLKVDWNYWHILFIDKQTFRYGHFMYVFGGYDGGTILNDLHRLNLDTCVWEAVETSGERPLALGRLRPGMCSTVPSVISSWVSVLQFAAPVEHSENSVISSQFAFQSSTLICTKSVSNGEKHPSSFKPQFAFQFVN